MTVDSIVSAQHLTAIEKIGHRVEGTFDAATAMEKGKLGGWNVRKQPMLTINDDGSAAGGRTPAGYGLVGMRERASLLGGTFHAGPTAERGWRVEAVLPRTGTPR